MHIYGKTYSELVVSAEMRSETKAQKIERLKKERGVLLKQLEELNKEIQSLEGTRTGHIHSNVNDSPRLAIKEVDSGSSNTANERASSVVGV